LTHSWILRMRFAKMLANEFVDGQLLSHSLMNVFKKERAIHASGVHVFLQDNPFLFPNL